MTSLNSRLNKEAKAFRQSPFWKQNPLIGSVSLYGDRETISYDYEGFARNVVKDNGIVYAAIQTRQLVFSEATFQWQRKVNGRPQELFGSPELAILEEDTGNLLSRMEWDASIAGNSYHTVVDDNGKYGKAATGPGRRIVRMRPDQVTLLIAAKDGTPNALDARVVAYVFTPSQMNGNSPTVAADSVLLTPDEVSHYAPIPDPEFGFMGMSWIRPVLVEIEADKQATRHKKKFFDNAATPPMVITVDKDTPNEDFNDFVEYFASAHEGEKNAYKTLILAAGADAKTVGADFRQLDFKSTQGAGETRIAAAAGVPAVILGISEGLSGSSLNQGNFSAARRRFADGTLRPLWRMAAQALQSLLTVPEGAYLTYDPREIAFLREDRLDAAQIEMTKASSLRQLTDAGANWDDAVRAIDNEDLSLLVGNYSGRFSVQLLPPRQHYNDIDEVNIAKTQAETIASLSNSYDAASVVEAVTSGDMSKLIPLAIEEPEEEAP